MITETEGEREWRPEFVVFRDNVSPLKMACSVWRSALAASRKSQISINRKGGGRNNHAFRKRTLPSGASPVLKLVLKESL